jgi:4-hydroxybenzoate polyprenyltransferase
MFIVADRTFLQKLNGYLAMARISNSPTVVSNVLVGAALAGDFTVRTIFQLAMALVCFYTAGMFLNDLCDYEIDRKERADRPLVTGIVTKSEAWGMTLALFAIGLLILATLGTQTLIGGVVLTGFIVLYDTWHKGNLISPVIMGANRFMVYVIAYLAFQPVLSADILIPAALLLLYILGVTFIARFEAMSNPAIKYQPLLALLLPALYYSARALNLTLAALVVIAGFTGWVLFSVRYIYSQKKIKRAVSFLLAGISLLDAAALAVTGWWVGTAAAVVCFALTLFFQKYVRGT